MRQIAAALMFVSCSAHAQNYDPVKLANDIPRLQNEWKACIAAKTVELGKDNSEGADTILKGVAAVCRPKEDELRAAYALSPLGSSRAENLMVRDRKLGEEAGIAALLQVRAKN